jgi:hypothetical protein
MVGRRAELPQSDRWLERSITANEKNWRFEIDQLAQRQLLPRRMAAHRKSKRADAHRRIFDIGFALVFLPQRPNLFV